MGSKAVAVVNMARQKPYHANEIAGRVLSKPPQELGADDDMEDLAQDVVARAEFTVSHSLNWRNGHRSKVGATVFFY